MPELGDVEGFRRVAQAVCGARIESIEISDPGVLRGAHSGTRLRRLKGRHLESSERIGKWLVIRTDGSAIVAHFGMTGSLRLEPNASAEDRFDRAAIATTRGTLRYRDPRRLGGIWVADDDDELAHLLGPIGPDALSVSKDSFRHRLTRGRGSIKSALLDQSKVAGIGNMLSDEILWRACIHPATKTSAITDDQWRELHRATMSVLHAVARAGHTPRGPRWLTGARGLEGATCSRCGTRLTSSRIAGRTSVWCPHCQRAAPGS